MSARPRLTTLLALAAVTLGAAGLVWLLPVLLGLAGGTVPEVASLLAEAARPPVTVAVPGTTSPLVGRALHFQRVTIAEEDPDHARAVSTLDFEGSFGATRVSSLGRETTHFVRTASGWQLVGSVAPTLAAAVSALAARRLALQTADVEALASLHTDAGRGAALDEPALRARLAHPPRNGTAQAWYLRSEAGEVLVTEEEGPPTALHRLRLVPRSGTSLEFVFDGSLL